MKTTTKDRKGRKDANQLMYIKIRRPTIPTKIAIIINKAPDENQPTKMIIGTQTTMGLNE